MPHPGRRGMPDVALDDKFYQKVGDFNARFAHGMPRMSEAGKLVVEGDALFGANVSIKGTVLVSVPADAQLKIPDGTELEDKRVTVAADGAMQLSSL